MGQDMYDLASWLVHNKGMLMAEMEPSIKLYIFNYPDRFNLFREGTYVNDLSREVNKQLYKTTSKYYSKLQQDELMAAFFEPDIDRVIRSYYIMEYVSL